MNGRAFFDTNILVYAMGPFDSVRSLTARRLLMEGHVSRQGMISYQVVQEFLNLAFRKFNTRIAASAGAAYLAEVVGGLQVIPWSIELMESALRVKDRYGFSWYDSVIVAAALFAGCTTLYTEDLQSGQVIEGLIIVNPFLGEATEA